MHAGLPRSLALLTLVACVSCTSWLSKDEGEPVVSKDDASKEGAPGGEALNAEASDHEAAKSDAAKSDASKSDAAKSGGTAPVEPPVEPPVDPAAPAKADAPTPSDAPVGDTSDEADTADTPAAAPGKPLVATKKFPGNAYGVIVDEQGRWVVDIIDFEYIEGGVLARELEAADGRVLDGIPDGSPALPEGWKNGDAWTLITRAGTVPKTAESYGAVVSEGSGAIHYSVRLGAAPRGASGPAIALRKRTGKDAPKLVAPKPVPIAVLGTDALAKITKAILTNGDREQSSAVGKQKLLARHVGVFTGRFPGDRTHAIVARLPAKGNRPAVSALLFAKRDGSIELFAIVDLDGDATDELVYEDEYHEGWYLKLVHWKQAKPRVRVLTGDGI